MHRAEGPYNSKVTGLSLYKNGPPGTQVDDHNMNAIQEEIAYCIEQAGVALLTRDTDTWNQLLLSVVKQGIGGIPLDTKMLVHADAAPLGWTIVGSITYTEGTDVITEELNDRAAMVTKGKAASSQRGGRNHPTGTWAPPVHQLTIAEMPTHRHGIQMMWFGPHGAGSPQCYVPFTQVTYSTYAGSDGAHAHGDGTWRPPMQTLVLCNKEATIEVTKT